MSKTKSVRGRPAKSKTIRVNDQKRQQPKRQVKAAAKANKSMESSSVKTSSTTMSKRKGGRTPKKDLMIKVESNPNTEELLNTGIAFIKGQRNLGTKRVVQT